MSENCQGAEFEQSCLMAELSPAGSRMLTAMGAAKLIRSQKIPIARLQ